MPLRAKPSAARPMPVGRRSRSVGPAGEDGHLKVFYDRLGRRFQTYDQWIASGAGIPATAPRPQ
jgi:hypothetical protein